MLVTFSRGIAVYHSQGFETHGQSETKSKENQAASTRAAFLLCIAEFGNPVNSSLTTEFYKELKMIDHKIMADCQMCDRQFEFGHGRYRGKVIPAYRLTVCNICFETNWDGWGPALEPRFEAHLKSHGLPIPQRNPAGYYPRGL